MKRYRIRLEDQIYDVKVLGDPRTGQVQVEVDGETFSVGVQDIPMIADVPLPPEIPLTTTVGADDDVVSPLPGVVKTIAVRTGQQVTADDPLVVIEAMKMDNVIRADRAGTIGAIYVTEGRQVSYGEPLLELFGDR
jgi:biotin carboxyl carrier protein